MATVDLWPAVGVSVPVPNPDSAPLPASGLVDVEITAYIRGIITSGLALTFDPLGSGDAPEPDYDADALYFVQLANVAGTYGGEVRHVVGRTAYQDGGEGYFVWDAASTLTANGGTITGPLGTGRWKRLESDRLEAKWFGALGDGSTNDYAACQAMFDAVPADGGSVYFPPGEYQIGTAAIFSSLVVPSNCTVLGAGTASRLIRVGVTGTWLLDLTEVENVRVSGLTFEHRGYKNFLTQIQILDCNNVKVDNCTFLYTDPTVPDTGDTLHAILARRNTCLTVVDNYVEILQFKLEGSTGGGKHIVSRNHFFQPHNYAASFVVGIDETPETPAGVADIVCTHNIVDTALSSGAFHFGADGETIVATFVKNITIADNIIRGSWDESGSTDNFGISVGLGVTSENIRIQRNTIINAFGTYSGDSQGIRVRRVADTVCDVDGLWIEGNTIHGFHLEGIEIACSGRNVFVRGNRLSQTRGILVRAAGANMEQVLIDGNIVDGSSSSSGIIVRANTGNLTDVMVRDNIAVDAGTRGIYALADATFTLSGHISRNRCRGVGQDYGIEQGGAGTLSMVYRDNDCVGSSVTGIRLTTGTASGRGNQGTGLITEASGIADVTNGGTSVTVTHGLAGCASATIRVIVSIVKASGDPVLTVSADTIGSTTFVARLSGATSTANYKVHWRAMGAEYV